MSPCSSPLNATRRTVRPGRSAASGAGDLQKGRGPRGVVDRARGLALGVAEPARSASRSAPRRARPRRAGRSPGSSRRRSGGSAGRWRTRGSRPRRSRPHGAGGQPVGGPVVPSRERVPRAEADERGEVVGEPVGGDRGRRGGGRPIAGGLADQDEGGDGDRWCHRVRRSAVGAVPVRDPPSDCGARTNRPRGRCDRAPSASDHTRRARPRHRSPPSRSSTARGSA